MQAPAADAVSRHKPVLLERCLDLLAPAIKGTAGSAATPGPAQPVMIDYTLGVGGYTETVPERFTTLGAVSTDHDPEATALTSARPVRFGNRFIVIQAAYDAVSRMARGHSVRAEGAMGTVLMGPEVSSLQFSETSRGFSCAHPASLDVRVDQGPGVTTRNLLEHTDATEFIRIPHAYGEEHFTSRIAAAIMRRRKSGDPAASTQDLTGLVRQSASAPARRSGEHPAKRIFQVLRIAVNAEFDVLKRTVPRALNGLCTGEHLVVESYQLLEDRIIKRALAYGATSRALRDFPVIPKMDRPYLELLTNGAEEADIRRLDYNPRSTPVRPRAAIRLRPTDQAPSLEASIPAGDRGRDPGRRSGQRTARRRRRS